MNQQCKVCGEPAAGFHFGAFTCEGCKSFFGRSYNNLNSISECKNNGECIINKKNRTACKSCRLRKCLLVGMSKSGSRYGRRSNWFKIHCLLQEQQQAAVAQLRGKNTSSSPPEGPPIPLLSPLAFPHANFGSFFRPDNPSSPSISSPDSDSSENGLYSPRVNGSNPFVNKDFYLPVPFHSMFMQSPSLTSPFILPSSIFPFPVTPPKQLERFSPEQVQNSRKMSSTPDLEEEQLKSSRPISRCSPLNNNDYSSKNKNSSSDNENILKCSINNNNNNNNNNNDNDSTKSDIINNNNNNNNNNNKNNVEDKVTVRSKRFYLDSILGLHSPKSPPRSPVSEVDFSGNRSPKADTYEEEQDNPIDLSIKKISFGDKKEMNTSTYCCSTIDSKDSEVPAKAGELYEEAKPIPLDLSI